MAYLAFLLIHVPFHLQFQSFGGTFLISYFLFCCFNNIFLRFHFTPVYHLSEYLFYQPHWTYTIIIFSHLNKVLITCLLKFIELPFLLESVIHKYSICSLRGQIILWIPSPQQIPSFPFLFVVFIYSRLLLCKLYCHQSSSYSLGFGVSRE